jgi:hypothetical protein
VALPTHKVALSGSLVPLAKSKLENAIDVDEAGGLAIGAVTVDVVDDVADDVEAVVVELLELEVGVELTDNIVAAPAAKTHERASPAPMKEPVRVATIDNSPCCYVPEGQSSFSPSQPTWRAIHAPAYADKNPVSGARKSRFRRR